jgi:hypothetical protein
MAMVASYDGDTTYEIIRRALHGTQVRVLHETDPTCVGVLMAHAEELSELLDELTPAL